MRMLITGGAGFIGSAVARRFIAEGNDDILIFDDLNYAGNLDSLAAVTSSPHYRFVRGDICDIVAVSKTFADFRPDVVLHLAAESHVDRSIDKPAAFIQTNVVGTSVMLDCSLAYFRTLSVASAARFRFIHISTDEVFGSLGQTGFFTEHTPYAPNSPYSASKAGSDHLVRAWRKTYGLPTILTNCSNNFGPYQYPEKLIPLIILNALEDKRLPVYGDGTNVRDWLYVEDHAAALISVARDGTPGGSYVIGGRSEKKNIEVVEATCAILDELRPRPVGSYRDLISFVADRPGHDLRYAIDCAKIERELGWKPAETFETGLRKTVQWYLDNKSWWQATRDGKYRGERLGALQ